MLRLKNIAKSDTAISADYYPEDSEEKGFVCIDTETGVVLDSKTTSYDASINAYLSHAVLSLKKMISADTLPSETIIMWY